jgi:hypothetical protein
MYLLQAVAKVDSSQFHTQLTKREQIIFSPIYEISYPG